MRVWVGISDVKEDSEVQGRDPDMHGAVLLCMCVVYRRLYVQ